MSSGELHNVNILRNLESSRMSQLYIIWSASVKSFQISEYRYYMSSGELQNVIILHHLESSRMSILYVIWRAPDCQYYMLSGVLQKNHFRLAKLRNLIISDDPSNVQPIPIDCDGGI